MRYMSASRSAWLCAGLFLAGIILPRAAFAEPRCASPGPVPPDAAQDAEAYYDKGRMAAKLGDYELARRFYFMACQKMDNYKIVANLADAEFRLEMYRDAAEHMYHYLKVAPSTVSVAARAMGEESLAKAQTHVGMVTLGELEPGADVLIDEVVVGRSPLAEPVFLLPGMHTFEASKPGFASARVVRLIAPGSSAEIPLPLSRVIELEPAGAEAKASAALGGAGALSTIPMPPPAPSASSPNGWQRGLAIGLGAVGVVGLGVGATTKLMARSRLDEIKALRTEHGDGACTDPALRQKRPCPEAQAKKDAFLRLDKAAIVGFAAGGAFVLGSVVLGIAASRGPSSGSAPPSAGFLIPTPVAAPNYGGLALVGRF